jgi:hypothetical protein
MQSERRESYNPLLKSYPDSEKVNAVCVGAETLFTRLLAQSDDLAHYYGEPAMILGKLYTRRMVRNEVSATDIGQWRKELAKVGLIELYRASDGQEYIEIVNCKKSLRNDLKKDVRFPIRSVTESRRNRDGIDTISARQPNPTQPNPTQEQSMSACADALPENSRSDKPQPDAARVRGEDFLPPGFSRWWGEWPRHFRKQGRAKCLKFWKAHKLEKIAALVIDALHRCKSSHDWQKQGGDFIPMPMTWLNRTPWETDPADMPTGTAHDANGVNGENALAPEITPTPAQVRAAIGGGR